MCTAFKLKCHISARNSIVPNCHVLRAFNRCPSFLLAGTICHFYQGLWEEVKPARAEAVEDLFSCWMSCLAQLKDLSVGIEAGCMYLERSPLCFMEKRASQERDAIFLTSQLSDHCCKSGRVCSHVALEGQA